MPFGPERPEVLARRRGPRLAHPVAAEMGPERVNYPLAGLPVVDVERIVIQRRDLRFARSARSGCLGIDDPLDRSPYARPDAGVESPHVQFDDGLVWNDVFFRPRLQHADGYDSRLRRGDLP